ncbi:MAG TPA: MBOAT family O-acyltransferase [Bacteroidales bacterium]|mgnify:FL=1|nr:MBOAT family O-acyltransferase [Bacteroidales bacterium]
MWNWISNILEYSEKSPMIFTRFYFWAFFAIVLLIYSLLANKRVGRSLFIFAASLFFYYKTSGFFFFLLLFSTITDYLIGFKIHKSSKEINKKLWVALSVFINLSVLAYFKYSYFITDAINDMFGTELTTRNFLAEFSNLLTGSSFDTAKIFLPVGISFFTFQTISYAVDVYRKKLKPVKNIIDFGFYVSFFPQLVAGPIVRAADFIPQIYKKFSLSRYDFGMAIFMILKGLIKKIMIGDYVAVNFVDRIFSNPDMYTGFESLLAMFGYSLQVYVDFSGYTDMAIGVALLMGFRLPINFNSPYKARNPGEFWSRWHISLSSWLKDYLYIPLGGNRSAGFGTYINLFVVLAVITLLSGQWWVAVILVCVCFVVGVFMRFFYKFRRHIETNINRMVTMLLGGLWHGASWNFILWGGINGLGVVWYKYWRKISPWENSNHWVATAWKIALTLSFITFTRVFFRAPDYDTATTMLRLIGTDFNAALIPQILWGYRKVVLMMIFGFTTHWLSYSFKDTWRDKFINSPHYLQAIISIVIIFIVYQSICAGMQPFIYFQF